MREKRRHGGNANEMLFLGGRSNGKEPDEPLNEGTGENHHGTNEEGEGNADELLSVRRRAK